MRRLLPLLLAVAACAYGFEKQSHVGKLRVLAVRADPPEIVLGAGTVPSVQFTALAVGSQGEPIEMEYALCRTMGLPAADLDCPGSDGIPLRSTGPLSARLDPDGFQ